MPPTEELTNGDFQSAPAIWNGSASWIIVSGAPGSMPGWTGSDIEWGRESLYVPGGSTTNRVIEMDGNGGSAVTSIQQSFSVEGQVNGVLTFDMALRQNVANNVGEGFVVDILDIDGNVIQSQTYTPTTSIWTEVTLSVPLEAGTYTIRFTEIGPNNSYGAVLDNVSFVSCFTLGTLIDTPDGPRRVEDLRPGDLVLTADDGPQPVRWVGRRQISLAELLGDPRLWPVTIRAGALGPQQPARDMRVSRQHRILRTGWACELHFAEPEILVPAHRLVNGANVTMDPPVGDVTYVHFLCDRHQIVTAEGLPTESFFPSGQSLSGVAADAKAELLLIFPELRDAATRPLDLARPVVEGRAARLVA